MAKRKRLTRSSSRIIAGVCSGIADYSEIDPTVVRVVWAVMTIFTAVVPGVVAYILCWILIPPR